MYFRAGGFDLIRPDSLDDAIAEHAGREDSAYLAGGTALLSSRYAGSGDFPTLLVSLGKVEGLAGIEVGDDAVRIGARTPLTAIETDARIAQDFPTLSEAARASGSWQVRTRATIGGNVGNASPTADLGPSLLALAGRVHYRDAKGEKEADMDQVWKGPGELNLSRSSVITAVELPRNAAATGSAYQRLSVRKAMDTAMAGASAAITLSESGEIEDARVVLGGVVSVPTRITKAEKALLGASATDATVLEEVSRIVESEARNSKLLQTRSSPTIAGYLRRSKGEAKDAAGEYRKRVVPILATRAIEQAIRRAETSQNGGSK